MSTNLYRIVRFGNDVEKFHVEHKKCFYWFRFMFEWNWLNTFLSIKECENFINAEKLKREFPICEVLGEY